MLQAMIVCLNNRSKEQDIHDKTEINKSKTKGDKPVENTPPPVLDEKQRAKLKPKLEEFGKWMDDNNLINQIKHINYNIEADEKGWDEI